MRTQYFFSTNDDHLNLNHPIKIDLIINYKHLRHTIVKNSKQMFNLVP